MNASHAETPGSIGTSAHFVPPCQIAARSAPIAWSQTSPTMILPSSEIPGDEVNGLPPMSSVPSGVQRKRPPAQPPTTMSPRPEMSPTHASGRSIGSIVGAPFTRLKTIFATASPLTGFTGAQLQRSSLIPSPDSLLPLKYSSGPGIRTGWGVEKPPTTIPSTYTAYCAPGVSPWNAYAPSGPASPWLQAPDRAEMAS